MSTDAANPTRRGPYKRESAEKRLLDDRERAARILREHDWSYWSYRRIAAVLGVSPATVVRITGPDSPLARIEDEGGE